MSTVQLDEVRQRIMSAAPGDSFWQSPEYRAYLLRVEDAEYEHTYGRAVRFALHGDVIHHYSCGEVGLLDRIEHRINGHSGT